MVRSRPADSPMSIWTGSKVILDRRSDAEGSLVANGTRKWKDSDPCVFRQIKISWINTMWMGHNFRLESGLVLCKVVITH